MPVFSGQHPTAQNRNVLRKCRRRCWSNLRTNFYCFVPENVPLKPAGIRQGSRLWAGKRHGCSHFRNSELGG